MLVLHDLRKPRRLTRDACSSSNWQVSLPGSLARAVTQRGAGDASECAGSEVVDRAFLVESVQTGLPPLTAVSKLEVAGSRPVRRSSGRFCLPSKGTSVPPGGPTS